MFATFIWKTFGRCCSRSDAVRPDCSACAYCRRASCRSSIRALITRSPIVIVMPCTAARVDPGKT